jgi:hypothetical protein
MRNAAAALVAIGKKVSAFILGSFALVWIDGWRPLGSKGGSG